MSKIITFIKQHKVVLAIDVILVVIYFILTAVAHNKIDTLYSQQEAKRWENDEVTMSASKNDSESDENDKKESLLKGLVGEKRMPYAQVSAFISPGRMTQADDINSVRSSIVEKLNKDSYSESLTDGRAWIDAYSCEASINLRKDKNTLSATAVGVGGDFFQFHPMKLLSGSYISDSDLNHDRIVVDENFAWAMFGSNDIVGMQVWINNNIYFVAGVVEVPKDRLTRLAYGNNNRVYMSYSELKRLNENLPITCYEAVLPNPISNYAYYSLREAFNLEEETEDDTVKKEKNPLSFDDIEVIENTKRYNSMELITNVKNRKLRTMRTAPVGYPFWENVARVQDDTQMTLIIIRIALLVFPILSLIWMIYGLWEKRSWTIKSLLLDEIEKERERRNRIAYEKKLAEKEALEEIIEVEGIDSEMPEEDNGEFEDESSDDETDEASDSDLDDDNGESGIELRAVTGSDLF